MSTSPAEAPSLYEKALRRDDEHREALLTTEARILGMLEGHSISVDDLEETLEQAGASKSLVSDALLRLHKMGRIKIDLHNAVVNLLRPE